MAENHKFRLELPNRGILLAGPSGIGKTSLASHLSKCPIDFGLSDENEPEFVSGSISDLIPSTKSMSHAEMLDRPFEDLYREDVRVLNLRHKLFSQYVKKRIPYVSDRSFLDVAGYFMYKYSSKVCESEVRDFLECCKQNTLADCSHLILLELTPDNMDDWLMEDNSKRILNRYFQVNISTLMAEVLLHWGIIYEGSDYKKVFVYNGTRIPYKESRLVYRTGIISSPYKESKTRVLLLKELDYETRCSIVKKFLNDEI